MTLVKEISGHQWFDPFMAKHLNPLFYKAQPTGIGK